MIWDLEKYFRHGQPEQTYPDIIGDDKGWTGDLIDPQVPAGRSYGRRDVREQPRRSTTGRPLSPLLGNDAEQRGNGELEKGGDIAFVMRMT